MRTCAIIHPLHLELETAKLMNVLDYQFQNGMQSVRVGSQRETIP